MISTKKKLLLLLFLFVILLVGAYSFYYYTSDASSFLTEEEMKQRINPYYLNSKIEVIQDIITIDNNHIYVPYITTEGEYAASYWYYNNRNWEIEYVGTISTPHLVSTNPNDPSTFYFVWNLHPADQIKSLEFYLLKRRNYSVSDRIEIYTPKLQMNFSTPLDEHSYGIVKLSEEFIKVLNDTMKLEAAQFPDFYYNGVFSSPTTEFAWRAFDHSGKSVYPEHSTTGGGSGGGTLLKYTRYLDDRDPELE
ncbi:hypothetical protein [Litchfieldia salsa]|uniref:Uncharacterized protein n=1 Tax=Litchfieldia salsa TaxID=930152 RepID=A0A1H0QCR4_9BACI|nr:hypothetical protein [Litchfieldia salsa]SDP14990.1 hypothetical protein SAMN05216565_101699 [Litchfieldia salsa]